MRSNLGKLLDAALHLHAFGGFVAETLDEILGVLNLFLLILVGAHLLFEALGAQSHIF